MIQIKLTRGLWAFDPVERLGGRGGFGEVFLGRSGDGTPVAVKQLYLTASNAAHRELRIAEQLAGGAYQHVLPVLDSGQDADSELYYVVMPRAERNLEEALDDGAPTSESEAVNILLQIAEGLLEVSSIIHRDLKPANILFHEGRWKIADFGIARFVEEATSSRTVRECLTPPYAAPEQWKSEETTVGTDVYALGCVAYRLINGAPPFQGPTIADFHLAHVSTPPPVLETADQRLKALVSAMLRKNPETRPSMLRVVTVLRGITEQPALASPGLHGLMRANALAAERRAQQEAQAAEEHRRRTRRRTLGEAGWNVFHAIVERLTEAIREQAPEASVSQMKMNVRAQLGGARLSTGADGRTFPEGSMPISGWDPVVLATISAIQEEGHYWTHGATLWYMRLPGDHHYRWYEVSYETSIVSREPQSGPFAQTNLGDADRAVGEDGHLTRIASGPTPIDDENVDDFVDRWIGRFARAFEGELAETTPAR